MSNLMLRAYARLTTALSREDGQAVTEYAVVLVLIVAIMAALTSTGIAGSIVSKIQAEINLI